MQHAVASLFWLAIYLLVVLSPLMVVLRHTTPAGRTFWVELSVALGFIALMQMGLQFALVARFRAVTLPYGIDVILRYHRKIAALAAAFILLHPVILIVRAPQLTVLLNPFGGTPASRWGVVSVLALLALLLTSYIRRQLRLSYEFWRWMHIFLSILAMMAALVHVLLVGVYTNSPWKALYFITFTTVSIGVLGYLRLVKPMTRLRRRYRVTEVIPERGRSWTLALEPDGHRGLRFAPGDFAWLTLRSPFSLNEHPFSFSSSAEKPERIEFGIKELGDFTSGVGQLQPGTTVYLDGPHGSFSIDRHPAAGYVFIAGGIGISPMMSMIRTLADREDPRPLQLLYGTRTLENAPFAEQLQELTKRVPLEVVHVLEEPPDGWTGERGWLDAGVLKRAYSPQWPSRAFFVCGPDPMMDVVERGLLDLGIHPDAIHMERFNLV